MQQALIDFYRGTGTDDQGRKLSTMHGWSDSKLEAVHNYIQWMFPLKEASHFNHAAPLLDDETIAIFRSDAAIQRNFCFSLETMLAFYGLEAGVLEIVPRSDFRQKAQNWLHANDHNHLRLTRIITSLRLVGLENEAQALYSCLAKIAAESNHVTITTQQFWRAAATR